MTLQSRFRNRSFHYDVFLPETFSIPSLNHQNNADVMGFGHVTVNTNHEYMRIRPHYLIKIRSRLFGRSTQYWHPMNVQLDPQATAQPTSAQFKGILDTALGPEVYIHSTLKYMFTCLARRSQNCASIKSGNICPNSSSTIRTLSKESCGLQLYKLQPMETPLATEIPLHKRLKQQSIYFHFVV